MNALMIVEAILLLEEMKKYNLQQFKSLILKCRLQLN